MIATPSLRFDSVSVRYGESKRDALDQCTFQIGRGEKVGLLGLNGSGKTTVLLAAAGLVPFSGSIEVFGTRVERDSLASIRQQLGFLFSVPDDQILLPLVLDDVSFTLQQRGADLDEAHALARKALETLKVGELADRHVYAISHGERLRVALAGVFASQPPLLLLDEPSTTLDPPGKRELAVVLARSHSSLLMSSNDFEFVERFCSRFLVLEAGRIIEEGSDLRAMQFYRENVF